MTVRKSAQLEQLVGTPRSQVIDFLQAFTKGIVCRELTNLRYNSNFRCDFVLHVYNPPLKNSGRQEFPI